MPIVLGGALPLWSPVLGVVTRAFSSVPVVHPVTKQKVVHLGTDLVAPAGRDVRALADGTVVATAKRKPGDTTTNGVLPGRTGSCVYIDHGAGLRSYYGHTAPLVTPGQRVTGGQTIGRSDGSGNITGPHLHLEVHTAGTAIDPEPWAEQRGLDIGITDHTAQEDDVSLTQAEKDALAWLGRTAPDIDDMRAKVADLWERRETIDNLPGAIADATAPLAGISASVTDLQASKNEVVQPALARIDARTANLLTNGLPVEQIVAGVLAGIPAGGGADPKVIADAVRAELAQALLP